MTIPEILFATPVEVGRPVDGLRWRARLTANALRRLGAVEILEITTDGRRPADQAVLAPRTRTRRALSRFHHRLPARIAARDWAPAQRALDRYDAAGLIWVMQPDLVGAGLRLPTGPLVVDMVDLEDGKYGRTGRFERRQCRRWASVQDRVVDRADAVVLANPHEVTQMGQAKAGVVPNSVDVDLVARHEESVADTVAIVGRFTYQPNSDGAEWFVTRVLPRLRAIRPDARVRLIGRHDGVLDHLRTIDGVDVVGFVPDLGPEWSSVGAMVAPIRVGTGTRIKIIEAFGRGVPVVSTTLGCEGLAVTDGIELLVADGPEALARACADVLADPAARRRMTVAARQYFEQAHAPTVFDAAVAAAVARAKAGDR